MSEDIDVDRDLGFGIGDGLGDGGEVDHNVNMNNQLAHVLTVTLTGLPELLLVLQDATQSIASSLSSSNLNGGSLSCVPHEWSLLCHTSPYALVLLKQHSEEWNSVVENGK